MVLLGLMLVTGYSQASMMGRSKRLEKAWIEVEELWPVLCELLVEPGAPPGGKLA